MSERDLDVLYIHPYGGHSFRRVVPMGAIALINAVSGSKLGRFDFDVTDSDIARAKIIAMDVHWFYSLASAGRLVRRIRRINPRARIIIGGYTAGIFHRQLVDKWGVDYVVIGDADRPFPELVGRILDGDDGGLPPNVTSADMTGEVTYTISGEEFDSMDFITIDWFPSLQNWIYKSQRSIFSHFVYPYLNVFRGCQFKCECMGNFKYQKALMGRGMVFRSPEAVASDFDRFHADSKIQYVYIVSHDPLEYPSMGYVDKIFTKKRNFSLEYMFYRLPKVEELEIINSCFTSVHLIFQPVVDWMRSFDLSQFARILEWARRVDEISISVFIAFSGLRPSRGVVKEIIKLHKKYPFSIINIPFYADVPLPNISSDNLDSEFKRYSIEAERYTRFHYPLSVALDWSTKRDYRVLNYTKKLIDFSSYNAHRLGFVGRGTFP